MKTLCTFFVLYHFLICSALPQSDTGGIQGRIVDENYLPLSGINVVLENYNLGTSTDENGNFQLLNVSPGKYTLVVSSVGYSLRKENVNIIANELLQLNLQLNPEIKQLKDISIRDVPMAPYYSPENYFNKIEGNSLETPKSIQTISSLILQDQQVIFFQQTLANISGVNARSNTNDITVRGYQLPGGSNAGSLHFVNGMRNYYTPYENELLLFNVEKIEFVKGPASVLYGINHPGGMINVVTKKPLTEARYSANFAVGTWGRYRVEADLTGPFTQDKKWLYRFTAAYYNSPDYRDFHFNRNFGVAPAITYQLNDKTRVDVEFMYNHTHRLTWYDWGYPAFNGDWEATPLEYTPHEPTDFVHWQSAALMAKVTQKITDNITFHTDFMGASNQNDGEVHAPEFSTPAPDAEGNVTRNFRKIQYDNSSFFLTSYFDMKLNTGPIMHKIVVGVDVFEGKRNGDIQQAGLAQGVPQINLFEPAYRQVSRGSYDLSGGFFSFNETNYVGGYFQDLISFTPGLHLMLGLRYEDYTYKSLPSLAPNDSNPWIPNIGAVYNPIENIAIYTTYSQGFIPQNNQSPDQGGPFDPETSEQLEVGAKTEFNEGKLSVTISLYQIKRKNQLVPDPDRQGIRIPTGETQSRGAEFDIMGSITPDLSVIANYAYNQTEITASTNEEVIGSELPNAPNHLGTIWAKYRFSNPGISGFSFALGWEYVGERLAGDNFSLPSYNLLNMALYYAWEKCEVSLNWNNLLDQRYVVGAGNQNYLQPGLPINAMIRFQVRL